MAVVFAYFKIPNKFQQEILFWGIPGALISRGILIRSGVVLNIAFVGNKMLLLRYYKFPIFISLSVIVGIIAVSMCIIWVKD